MNFEFNKVAGAILGTGLGVMAISIIAEFIYTPEHPAKPGYVIAVAGGEAGGGGAQGGGQPEVQPIAVRLQNANVDDGKSQSKKCQACHTLGKGEPKKIGPNLWNVVGSPIIHPDNGFGYSDAFKKKGQEGFTWTFENLDTFITSPRRDIPGTAMSFAGITDPQQRADVIAYLRTLSDNPVPLPEPAAAPAAANEAPAAGNAAPAAPTDANAAPAATQPDQGSAAPAASDGNKAPAGSQPDQGAAPATDGANPPPAAPESPAAGSQN